MPALPVAALVIALVIALLLWRLARLGAALERARCGEARLRLIAEHSIDAGWIIDCASSELLYISPVARARFGADAAALAAQLCAGLPERMAALAQGDQSCLRQVRQLELPGPDGAPLAAESHSSLVAGANGQAAWLVGVLRDTGERHAHEKEQKRLASMLSHEFRTPLTTIDGAIQRLEMTAGAADEATRKRYRKIGAAVERLLELIDEYLSPERMAGLGRARAPHHCAPRALLDEAAARADSPQHPVRVRGGDLPASLRCDPDGMRMCLQVLLDNAIKYTPPGSPIELAGGAAPEGGVELLVLDRGPGIAADEMGRVFDKTFRGRAAIGQPGGGLGLYMARSVIEHHGGTLSVRNRGGGGAAFRIWLPFQLDPGKYLASNECKSNNSQE